MKPTPDDFRMQQALLYYGATPACAYTILQIARDMQATAYSAGHAARSEEVAMAWSFNEMRWRQ